MRSAAKQPHASDATAAHSADTRLRETFEAADGAVMTDAEWRVASRRLADFFAIAAQWAQDTDR